MDLIVSEGENGIGKTVIADRDFCRGDKVIDFEGPILDRDELPENIIAPKDDRFLQIREREFIGPSGEIDDLINHSCEPNLAVIIEGHHAYLRAIKAIQKGEEVAFDYSVSIYDDSWTMECHCGSKKCRKVIGEYKYLPEDTKRYYESLGIVPGYNLKG